MYNLAIPVYSLGNESQIFNSLPSQEETTRGKKRNRKVLIICMLVDLIDYPGFIPIGGWLLSRILQSLNDLGQEKELDGFRGPTRTSVNSSLITWPFIFSLLELFYHFVYIKQDCKK